MSFSTKVPKYLFGLLTVVEGMTEFSVAKRYDPEHRGSI